jgi:DNA-binding response OmpR family regulator
MLDHPISVRSWPGRGSVFGIRVPVADTAAPAKPARAFVPAGDLAGLKVLCLDNDREILDGMEALLGRWGVAVRVAETVAVALDLARDERPDVLVADYHLHDQLDGLEALVALRGVCGAHTPAVLVTADGSDTLKRSARDLGIPVLTKPIKPASLRAFLAAQQHRTTAG